jgi:Fe-S cluster assembly protein SufD
VELQQAKDLYSAHFDRRGKSEAGKRACWTRAIRQEAIDRFAQLGFPTPKNEDWKYTNVAPILKIPFEPAAVCRNGLTRESLRSAVPWIVGANGLVFINGHYAPELSSPGSLAGGVRIGDLASAIRADRDLVEPYLAKVADYREHGFIALSTAFMRDGAFIFLPKGAVIQDPLHLVFLASAAEEAFMTHPRSLIVASEGSQATIVESYLGLGDNCYFTNAVTELAMGEDAVIEHHKVEKESVSAFHIATLQVHQGRGSSFRFHSVGLGGSLVRNDVNVVLDGERSECSLDGLYLAGGSQHVDNHTRIDHVKPHSTSREFYKGVLGGKARGVFNGKIIVHPEAAKTDARQTNKNLLLSKEARIDTKPQLEIFNNDVKCSHGSTIGQLSQEAIFYLRSRGIGIELARSMLTRAFVQDLIDKIRIEPLRAGLADLLDPLLLGGEAMEFER